VFGWSLRLEVRSAVRINTGVVLTIEVAELWLLSGTEQGLRRVCGILLAPAMVRAPLGGFLARLNDLWKERCTKLTDIFQYDL